MRKDAIDYNTLWNDKKSDALKIIKRGGTIADVAKFLGGSKTTFYNWLQKTPDAKLALDNARSGLIVDINNALYRNAIGYTTTETKVTVITNPDGSETTKRETTTRQVPPNQRAIETFLRNYTDNYRDSDDFTQKLKTKELDIKEQKANNAGGEDW